MYVAGLMSGQLRQLPVNLSLQCSNAEVYQKAVQFVTHLYHIEKIRPGQVGISLVENISDSNIRFSIEKFEK